MINQKLNRYSPWHIFFITMTILIWFTFSKVTTLPLSAGIISLIFFQLSLLLYIIALLKDKKTIMGDLGLELKRTDISRGILTAVANLSFVIMIAPLLPEIDSVIDRIPKEFNITFFLMFLSFCFIGPIMEEILFRGYLWKILEQKKISGVLILIITSLLFALFHFELIRLPILFIGGIIFGFSRFKTGRLGISIIGHIVNNTLVFIISITLG